MNKRIILSTAYLAPIQYYSKFIKYDKVFIEQHENFVKQTYRNRCKIYSANGELSLSIPVKKNNPKTLIKDILIDYDTNWRKLHWKSIESAYRSSPFFEFYEDDLRPFYERKYKFLIEFNTELQSVVLEHLDIEPAISFTNEYVYTPGDEYDDFREIIAPKKEFIDNDFTCAQYKQVFQEKHGFIANLSIIDLLFNEGPNAIDVFENI